MKQYLDLMREVRRRASSRKTALGPALIASSVGKCVSTWRLIFRRRRPKQLRLVSIIHELLWLLWGETRKRQARQCPMYLHQGKGIALAIREERGPQLLDLLGNRERARCELQKCG